jgi:uroporphyrinogen decarboxylase
MVLVFDPAACPEVVPPGLFREMIGPRAADLFAGFRRAGALANWLHIAGRTGALLPRYAALGADLATFDYCVDAQDLVRSLGATRLCLAGNVTPLAFVTGGPEDIARECAALLGTFERRGGFILSSGCEIPPEAREANVAALVRAAVMAGREPA